MSMMEADMLDLRQIADVALQSALQRPPVTSLPQIEPSLPPPSPLPPKSRAQTDGGMSEDGEAFINRDPTSVEHVDEAIFGLMGLISSLSGTTNDTFAPAAGGSSKEDPSESSIERKAMYDQYKAQEAEREAGREAARKKAALKAEQEAKDRQVSRMQDSLSLHSSSNP